MKHIRCALQRFSTSCLLHRNLLSLLTTARLCILGADALYGVTIGNDSMSTLVSVELEKAV